MSVLQNILAIFLKWRETSILQPIFNGNLKKRIVPRDLVAQAFQAYKHKGK